MAERRSRAPKQTEMVPEGEQQEDVLDPQALAAFDFLTNNVDGRESSLTEIYDTPPNTSLPGEIELNLRKQDGANVLYLAELLIGDAHADPRFLEELLAKVQSLPEEMKPDAIVMSGIVQGEMRGYRKSLRPGLKQGLRSLNDQLYHARQVLQQLEALDVPVTYVMGDDDMRIVKELTTKGFGEIESLARERLKHASADEIMKVQLTKAGRMEANPQWAEYYDFTRDVVFPYCLRAGRDLYNAEEVANITGGASKLPERELLYEAYKNAQDKKSLTAVQKMVLDVSALKDSASLVITSDHTHVIRTKKHDYNDLIEHNVNSSDVAMPGNYLGNMRKRRGGAKANGDWDADNHITLHQQEAMGYIYENNEGSHSIGALQDPNTPTPYREGIDKTRRMKTVRGRAHSPSASQIERTGDGRQIITLHNRALWEKSESIAERTAIVMHCDWQTGSISARPDLQLKHLDMTRRLLGRMPVVIALGGDMLHGRNYSDFPRESQRTGMMSMDSQEEFVRTLIEMNLNSMTRDEIDNMTKVLVQIGNHEWNSGTLKWHGYSFASYLTEAYRKGFQANGYTPEEAKARVQFQDTIVTQTGEPVRTYSSVDKIGDVGLEVRHFFGKGGGSNGPTVLTAQRQSTGVGDLKEGVDVMMFGHYHHPNYMLNKDKIIIGAGSLAGMTGFEYELGLRSVPSAVTLYIGGGLPPQIEFISEETFHKHKIVDGPFSDRAIREAYGYRNDRMFDAGKHTPYLDDRFPKSALQKLVLQIGRQASYSVDTTGFLPERRR